MPDRRRHRGAHPADAELFGLSQHPVLRTAVYQLSWLLARGYSATSALKLVGDRFALRERQRRAVLRSVCTDAERTARAATQRTPGNLSGATLAVDGFNCIITTEAALSGGAVIIGRDGAHRDMASVHGSYRKVEETERAAELLGQVMAGAGVELVHWYLDRPVSNSGRLRALLADLAARRGWTWRIELADNPDKEVIADRERITASCDAWILDECAGWVDLPGAVIANHIPDAWLIDLRGGDQPC